MQAPLYQFQSAEVPNNPPVIPRVVELPWQIVENTVVADIAETEVSFTVIILLTQIVVLHIPSALTKYSEVTDGLTVNAEPFPIDEPPQEPLYQYQSADVPKEPPFTLKVVEKLSHIVLIDAVIKLAGVEFGLTVTSILEQDVVLHTPSPLTK